MITALKLQLVACMSLLFLLVWALKARSQEMDIPRGSYEMQVMPDTVDLTRSADLAMNAITRCTNPDITIAFISTGISP